MKKIIKNTLLISIIAITAGCTKKIEYLAERTFITTDNALLKINYLSAYAANPGVQLAINNTRVSGLITGRTPLRFGKIYVCLKIKNIYQLESQYRLCRGISPV